MAKPFFESDAQNLRIRRQLSPSENAIRSAHFVRLNTSIGLAIAVAVGIVVILLHGGHSTTAVAAFGAALGTGGVLGFLFGVPSAPKGIVTNVNANKVAMGTGEHAQASTETIVSQPPAPDEQPPASPAELPAPAPDPAPQPQSTSNLEQVADWVTKLLLGGGLTQMQRIPPTIWRWAHLVALGIVGDNPAATDQLVLAQQSFAAGLLVYAFILGFFSGFLITKLELGSALAD